MLDGVNKEILSFLFKCNIPMQDADHVREGRTPHRTDMSRLQTRHDEYVTSSTATAPQQQGGDGQQPQAPRPKPQPVRVEQKIGRNDPCPCGSGKKYKNCHGNMEV